VPALQWLYARSLHWVHELPLPTCPCRCCTLQWSRKELKEKRAQLLETMRQMPDYTMQLKWELGSSVPGLVGGEQRAWAWRPGAGAHAAAVLWALGVAGRAPGPGGARGCSTAWCVIHGRQQRVSLQTPLLPPHTPRTLQGMLLRRYAPNDVYTIWKVRGSWHL